MPARNVVKQYIENGYYHLYNRGVEKRTIFQNQQDSGTFLGYLKQYLSPASDAPQTKTIASIDKSYQVVVRSVNNYSDQIDLLAYCLMPNHFHLLVKQTQSRSIASFMQSLCTRYTMYFNKAHDRVGRLFQGTYKGVLINTNAQLLHLSRYIHLNPLTNKQGPRSRPHLLQSHPSSYADYLGLRTTEWVKPNDILGFFHKTSAHPNSYKSFVETPITTPSQTINHLTLE